MLHSVYTAGTAGSPAPPFKQRPFEERQREASDIRQKYPDRIPIIVEAAAGCKLQMNKKKFLVPGHYTVGEFVYFIRKHITLGKETALFIFCNNIIPITKTNCSGGLSYKSTNINAYKTTNAAANIGAYKTTNAAANPPANIDAYKTANTAANKDTHKNTHSCSHTNANIEKADNATTGWWRECSDKEAYKEAHTTNEDAHQEAYQEAHIMELASIKINEGAPFKCHHELKYKFVMWSLRHKLFLCHSQVKI